FKELKKMGAVEIHGTVDPAKAEKWLKRTERVFSIMRCTMEDRFDFVVSLLQGDGYNWWETVPNATVNPLVLVWEEFC
uniref:hypothetical protein n=1 Tax=Vibrio vulnificus TaxID=672 RepID=UPI0019D47638